MRWFKDSSSIDANGDWMGLIQKCIDDESVAKNPSSFGIPISFVPEG